MRHDYDHPDYNEHTDTDRVITIHTSCGLKIEQPVSEMSLRQLRGLLEENDGRTDLDQTDRADLAAMRDELWRRCHRE